MDVAHVVLVVIHVAGIVALLAGLLVQVRRPEKRVNALMRDGIGTAFLAGLFLVAVLEAGDDPVDRTKIAVKFAIGLVVLVLVMANLRTPRIPDGLYWSLLVLTLVDVGVALVANESGPIWARVLGFVALTFASVNIFGGFLVTQRMLGMYQKKKK